jgi:outer membrane protein TolC
MAWIFLAALARAETGELSLAEVFRRAEARYPTLSAARARVAGAESAVGVARSAYLPTVEAAAIYSTGFPGSSGGLGIQGLVGSAYRSGLAGGLVLRQNLWDFGRTSAGVEAAREERDASRDVVAVARFDLEREAMTVYYDCGRYRSQLESWRETEEEARAVEKEISHFVRTGQRSEVDRYLAAAQTEEAAQAVAGFEARLRVTSRRLALMVGMPEEAVICPRLPVRGKSIGPVAGTGASPLVARARKEIEAARSRLSQARAGHLPRLVGIASVGDMQNARLVPEQSYALGVGLIIPIFDGWRTSGEVDRASAKVQEKEAELAVTRQRLSELSTRYDELIESSRARLEHLERELDLAEHGFQLAKERYFSFRGVLVDLREALRNLTRVEGQANDAWADLLQAEAAKRLVNGEAPPPR